VGDEVWYFAYGSNLDPERFHARVGGSTDRKPVILRDYALRFSGEVTSEGGGGAIIEPQPGGTVHGGVYRITEAQLAQMDEFELNSPMNFDNRGARITISVEADDGELEAEVYVVPSPEVYRAPSDKYLGHILDGLRAFGYSESVIDQVRATAESEPSG
jgi:gamma-glutamylcyclotransferase (GGCT)/AIG2-like uncharacterized protein YtfP